MTVNNNSFGGLTGAVNYTRILPNSVKTDPFAGLCLGAFGPHGPELLQLQRSRWDDGEECVVGVKLTGMQRDKQRHRAWRLLAWARVPVSILGWLNCAHTPSGRILRLCVPVATVDSHTLVMGNPQTQIVLMSEEFLPCQATPTCQPGRCPSAPRSVASTGWRRVTCTRPSWASSRGTRGRGALHSQGEPK